MCKTIKQKVRFKASPETIYNLLADARQRTEVTGRKVVMSDQVGGKFSTDAGQVTGVNVDLMPGRRLVQAWRRKDFPEGVYSMAAITLDPTPGGGTELVLTHRGVPKHLLDQIENYWRAGYWAPMKKVLATSITILLFCVSALAQWGDAVEGVQLRLAMAATLATPQLPPLEVQLRNQGTSAMTYVAEALSGRPAIEIDGVWYGMAGAGSCCSSPQTVAVGSQSSALPLRLQGFSNDRINVTVQSPAAHRIVLISNTITFEVSTVQALPGQPVSSEVAARALDMAKACIAKSPAEYRSVWGSPLNFGAASVTTRPEADHLYVFISETSARGKPQGVAIDVNTTTGACINFTNKLE